MQSLVNDSSSGMMVTSIKNMPEHHTSFNDGNPIFNCRNALVLTAVASSYARHRSRGQSAGPRDSGLGACHQKDAEGTGSDAAIGVRVNSLHTTGIAHSKHGIGIRDLTQTHPISIRNPGGSKHKLSQPGKRSAPRK